MSNKELERFRRRMVNAIISNDPLSASIISTQLIQAGYTIKDFKEYVATFEMEFELAQELKNREMEDTISHEEAWNEQEKN